MSASRGALRRGDRRPACALGLHLLVHRTHHVDRRVDALQFDALHPHAPRVGGVVEDLAQAGVDRVARRQRLVELEVADEVAQVRLGQLRHGQDEVGDVVDQPLRIGGLVVDDGVDADDDVVGRDDLLRWHVDDLLAHVDVPQLVDERDDQPEARVDGGVVPAEPLDDTSLVRLDDLDRRRHEHQQQQEDRGSDDGDDHVVGSSRRRRLRCDDHGRPTDLDDFHDRTHGDADAGCALGPPLLTADPTMPTPFGPGPTALMTTASWFSIRRAPTPSTGASGRAGGAGGAKASGRGGGHDDEQQPLQPDPTAGEGGHTGDDRTERRTGA